MEREIGETFEYEGEKLKVIKAGTACDGCYFKGNHCDNRNYDITGICGWSRKDNQAVIFIKVTEEQKQEQQETEEPKEREIGEVFEYEGKKLKVMKGVDGCTGCYFKEYSCRNNSIIGECIYCRRNDHTGVIFVDITDEPEEQPQEEQPKLNLCEVLKYCPQGETFWSPMLGDVKLNDIDQESKKINVILASGATWDINADGTITIDNVTSPEVMLYPSCEQMAWTKVKYEKKKELPRTWEEFCKNYERKKGDSYIDLVSKICTSSYDSGFREINHDRNILPSKQAAEAHLAYMQLHQLRDAWREGWLPDWTDEDQTKYVILNTAGEFTIRGFYSMSCFLAFQDEKRAEEFLECFRDFIEKAGDLI